MVPIRETLVQILIPEIYEGQKPDNYPRENESFLLKMLGLKIIWLEIQILRTIVDFVGNIRIWIPVTCDLFVTGPDIVTGFGMVVVYCKIVSVPVGNDWRIIVGLSVVGHRHSVWVDLLRHIARVSWGDVWVLVDIVSPVVF